jgi:hypothetical protein
MLLLMGQTDYSSDALARWYANILFLGYVARFGRLVKQSRFLDIGIGNANDYLGIQLVGIVVGCSRRDNIQVQSLDLGAKVLLL